ncbi:PH domain-containing protein [Halobacillus hunanensis]|uniref:PH domain-containing protein n=1 Tax=Halobacillus hunanensis TaxID=578214 RepID=UPI0009A61A2D|nr:PH domain-containing protein [Halobacillus hunanensis]
MPTLDEVKQQIKHLDGMEKLFGGKEIKVLPNILHENEKIERMITGSYDNGNGISVATEQRIIFIDKGMFGKLKVGDFNFSELESIDSKLGVMFGKIVVTSSTRKAKIENVDKKQMSTFVDFIYSKCPQCQDPLEPSEKVETTSNQTSDVSTTQSGFFQKAKHHWDNAVEEAKRKDAEHKQRKADKKEALRKELAYWFGSSPSTTQEVKYSVNREAFKHLRNKVFVENEKPQKAIFVEYDKRKNTEIDGVLVATTERLIFAYKYKYEQYVEDWDYSKIKGFHLKPDGFKWELYFEIGRSKKKFDDIKKDDNLKEFLSIVEQKINQPQPKKKKTSNRGKQPDKYQQLEKIGKLKEQGILTEDEFQSEKQKILNS